MLEEGIPTKTESKSAITSINLVLNKIETSNEKALEILNHLSYCDGQHITKYFIRGISKHLQINDEYLLTHAVSLLVSYSMLDRLDDDSYAMHEMTQLARNNKNMQRKHRRFSKITVGRGKGTR